MVTCLLAASLGVLPPDMLMVPAPDMLAVNPRPVAPTLTPYQEAYLRAEREGKHLVVWVGGWSCPPCQAALSDCVHVHCPAGDPWGQEPGVVVGRRRAGGFDRTDLPAGSSVWQMRMALQQQASFVQGVACGPNGCGASYQSSPCGPGGCGVGFQPSFGGFRGASCPTCR